MHLYIIGISNYIGDITTFPFFLSKQKSRFAFPRRHRANKDHLSQPQVIHRVWKRQKHQSRHPRKAEKRGDGILLDDGSDCWVWGGSNKDGEDNNEDWGKSS